MNNAIYPMHDQPPIPTRDIPYPFKFDQHAADVTLRASDSVSFHIHAQILSQASSFFATMFALPQPVVTPNSNGAEDSPEAPLTRPLIDVVEDSKVLEPLLRLCYSVHKTDLRRLDSIAVLPVLEAAIKYDMEQPIMDALTTRLLERGAECALQVWAFGCRHGLEQVTRGGAEALRTSLPRRMRETLSFLPDIPPSLQGLDGISGGQYFRLLQFIRRRDDSTVDRRISIPSTNETGSSSTGVAETTYTWEDFSLLRPPKIATTAITAPAPSRRKVLELVSFTDGEGISFLERPSTDVRSPDIVCRCHDGTEFEAHQQIISLHSPVLKEYIATLNPNLEGSQPLQHYGLAGQAERLAIALPVLQLKGPSHAISTLLCVCYQPQHRPRWSELSGTRLGCIELLAVATKYQIQPAIDLATTRWKALAHLHPRNSGMRSVSRTSILSAAPAALGWCPLVSARLGEYSRVLEDFPARTYHQLFVYLEACSSAAVQALEKATNAWELTAAERSIATGQSEPEAAAPMYRAVASALNRRRWAMERREVAPKADHVRAIRWSSYRSVASPPSLRDKFKKDLESLLASIPREIDDAISKASVRVHAPPPSLLI